MEKIMLYIVGIFFIIGIIDYIFGGKLKLSKGVEGGIQSMGSLALSMIGILSITPIISDALTKYIIPLLSKSFIEPSIISSSLIAVDMGGYKIAEAIGRGNSEIYFSGILISSILGCTISFTLPLALGIIKEESIDILCKGVLCGIVTVPIGLFIGGILLKMSIINIFISLLPILVISALIIIGLYKMPSKMIIYFKALAKFIFIIGLIGLGLQGIKSITGIELVNNLLPLEEALTIVGKIAIFLAGANVMLEVIKLIFKNNIKRLEKKLGINSASVTALIGSLASAVIVFTDFDKLDDRGKMICSAFSVAGAYVFGGQLGYVATEAKEIVLIYILVKLICGFLAIVLAIKITQGHIE
ncbi:ethanolamine utilization protein EutH [Clostridium nigeriense]|uniref:ethanolamine utilization protein EutH n=1 Tax=Clostridium nigeriense TaxID=1805470 RepID=UPI0008360E41|nr:ethanolamine utilization protein EutH [Clostridium nigeriense]